MNPQIDASQKLPKPWHTINLACMALICCTYTSCWFCRISLHDGSRILIPISETLEQFCEDHILHSKHQHVFWFTAHAHMSWNWLPLENHNTRCRWRSKPVFLEFWLFCVNFALEKEFWMFLWLPGTCFLWIHNCPADNCSASWPWKNLTHFLSSLGLGS